MTTARELRFAFTFEDYEAAVRLFRDVFGLKTLMDLERQGGRGVILSVPSATLEIFDARHTEVVDEIEVGRPTGERVRIAVRVDDLGEASAAVAHAGAEVLAEPVLTPWGDRNQRFRLPEGLQLTMFAAEEPS
jgi:catechol 2,3-dioxygenase-like lactoylglutathione lyase family enzyme